MVASLFLFSHNSSVSMKYRKQNKRTHTPMFYKWKITISIFKIKGAQRKFRLRRKRKSGHTKHAPLYGIIGIGIEIKVYFCTMYITNSLNVINFAACDLH